MRNIVILAPRKEARGREQRKHLRELRLFFEEFFFTINSLSQHFLFCALLLDSDVIVVVGGDGGAGVCG